MKKLLLTVLALALTIAMAIPALAADDVVIYDFANSIDAEDSFGFNTGLAGIGFATPTVTIENEQMKMTFTGNSQTNAAIGGYLPASSREWVTALAEQAPDYKYIRLYLENNTPGAFYITFTFSSTSTTVWGTPDMTKAVMINTAGETIEATVSPDLNGYTNGYIQLPAGFKGWLFMETDASTFGPAPDGWGKTELTSWTEVSQFEWDMRQVGDVTEGNNYMIWDDLALVNEAVAPAATDPGTDDKPATDDPNQGGDVSMLLYAAAAVSGLGALAIRRKK